MASFFQRFNIDDNQITETAKNKHKRLDCQTWQFFSCSNSLRLPVHYDTTFKNTVAHSTFEHLDHHNISKSSFYHTNHTFLTSINVWMMDFWSINARIKKNSSAQNTILCREWLLQKLTFHHNEITIFKHSQYPNQRTFGEPPAPSVYIYIYMMYIKTYNYIYLHMIHMYPCTMNTEISKQVINRMPCPPYSPNSSKPEVPGTWGIFWVVSRWGTQKWSW